MQQQSGMVQLQTTLEQLFNKNQLMPRLRDFYSATNHPVVAAITKALPIPEDYLVEVMVQMALHKRTTPDVMVGILITKFGNAAQDTSTLLEFLVTLGVVNFGAEDERLIVVHDIPPSLQKELDTYQYPLPLVVKPQELKDNHDTGYYTSKNSVILKNGFHLDDVNLDHINRMNQAKLALNMRTAKMVSNRWNSVDRPKEDETLLDFQKRRKAFDKYNAVAGIVMDIMVQAGNSFHLTHKYDRRGRTYCQGHHITYQGAPWNKAVVVLADKEHLE